MGQDWYSCDVCGEAVSDYHPEYTSCECGKTFCDDECASEAGFVRYDEDYEGEIPTHPKHGWELESSCAYCRGEIFEDDELLEFALKLLEIDRGELVKRYKSKEVNNEK